MLSDDGGCRKAVAVGALLAVGMTLALVVRVVLFLLLTDAV
jgi:hypothetical protein